MGHPVGENRNESRSGVAPRWLGRDSVHGRDVWLAPLDSFTPASHAGRSFASLAVMDASGMDTGRIAAFCTRLADLGCVYFCAWGPDCERVHDIMDEVSGARGCLITTWHAGESMEEALWFLLHCAHPDEAYAPDGIHFYWIVAAPATHQAIEAYAKANLTRRCE